MLLEAELLQPRSQPRVDRDSLGLVRAFLFSILIHVAVFSFWQMGYEAGLFATSPRKAWTEVMLRMPPQTPLNRTNAVVQNPVEVPLIFVEVDPSKASEEPPPSATFYSSQSTLAANPSPIPVPVSNQPRVEGTQQKVVKTFDTLKPQPQPVTPVSTAPVLEPNPVVEAKPKPKAVPEEGNLEFAKPAPRAITATMPILASP